VLRNQIVTVHRQSQKRIFSLFVITLANVDRFLPRDAHSAKRGITVVSRPSVRPSVLPSVNVDVDSGSMTYVSTSNVGREAAIVRLPTADRMTVIITTVEGGLFHGSWKAHKRPWEDWEPSSANGRVQLPYDCGGVGSRHAICCDSVC